MADDDRYFCLVFLQCEGSIKDVERVMGISYPTVKGRLERIRKYFDPKARQERQGRVEAARPSPTERQEILAALERGDVDFEAALQRLKGLGA